MGDNRSGSYNIVVGVLSFLGFIFLFLMLGYQFRAATDAAIRLPLLVIIGVMALFATLALVAVTFSVADLSDETQALGLPEGSVRAAIALSLIIIFAILCIYLYTSISIPSENAKGIDQGPAIEFAKQVFAVVGTLMTSVASFYFASRAVTPQATPSLSTPSLVSVTPAAISKAAASVVVPIKISGTDLQLAKTVTFEGGGSASLATNVSSNEQSVTCEITIEPSMASGKYDVVVRNSDGAVAKLPSALEILAPAVAANGAG